MSSLFDGGRIGSTACASSLEGRRHLTCENDRAKPDHISRLACSTNLSKILEGGPPKRYPLDRGPDSRPAVLELDAHRPISPLAQRASAFLREPFKVIKVPVAGQRKNPPEPLWITRLALRKNQKSGQQKSLEPLGLAGDQLPGHAMACSLWDSLQGFNGAHRAQLVRPYEPASHFPHL
jgi:hypothetical protein